MALIAGQLIDTKLQSDNPLEEGASRSASLTHKCSSLREKLRRIRGFADHFPILSQSRFIDPVTYLWDLFSTGTPLCYIFDQLPAEEGFPKINHYSLSNGPYEPNSDRAEKYAIALFALQIRTKQVTDKILGCEMFTVADLWDRQSTEGLVKVINTVIAIVDYLPLEAFKDNDASPGPLIATNTNDIVWNDIIREMLETERKYVEDLNTMQVFCNALAHTELISQDTLYLLFPNISKLLVFQRRFLLRLEYTSQLPFQLQRWGQQFLENEEAFSVYEPYWGNYKHAIAIMVLNEQRLAPFNHIIDVKSELLDFLLKPIQRICQYPLLLDSLVKSCSAETYQHYYELVCGLDATRRIIDKIDEAQRRSENEPIVNNLRRRVEDWKGHLIESFGELVLYDFFLVTRSDLHRPYSVFLFEHIVLLCKENVPKVDRKQKSSKERNGVPSGEDATAMLQKTTPLLLKGRVFIRNIISATYTKTRGTPLVILWKSDDGHESFTLQCRHEEQRKKWQAAFMRLIREAATRQAVKFHPLQNIRRPVPPERRHAVDYEAAARVPRYFPSSAISYVPLSMPSQYSGAAIVGENSSEYIHDDEPSYPDSDQDDLEDYSPPSYPSSGRETPVNARRLYRSQSLSITRTTRAYSDANLRRSRSNSLPSTSMTMSISVEVLDKPLASMPFEHSPALPLDRSRFSSLPILQRRNSFRDEHAGPSSSSVKLKVRFQEDIFILVVPRTIEFTALQEKLGSKIRLCDPSRASKGPLRVRYQDEDGDMISLASTEDLQIALEYGAQVVLLVT